MSVIRPKPPEDPLHYDPAGVLAAGGLSRSSLDGLAPRLGPEQGPGRRIERDAVVARLGERRAPREEREAPRPRAHPPRKGSPR